MGDLSGDEIAGIAFMVILGGSLLGSLMRSGVGQSMRHAAVWGLIFVGMVAAIGMWGDIKDTILPRQAVLTGGVLQLPRQTDGHYYVTAEVNGKPVQFVIDTGASLIVLNQRDAELVGLDPANLAYVGIASTANGEVATASVRLDKLVIGDIAAERVRASVNKGELDTSLLGMSFLSRFSSIEITQGKMILTP